MGQFPNAATFCFVVGGEGFVKGGKSRYVPLVYLSELMHTRLGAARLRNGQSSVISGLRWTGVPVKKS